MKVFLNGQIVPEEQAMVSVFDRGFLYGDGLFETIRVHNSKPFRWAEHLARLEAGARFLHIPLPLTSAALRTAALRLIQTNGAEDAVLRIQITRGRGVRGYSPRGAESPSLVMTTHPLAAAAGSGLLRWKLATASCHLPVRQPLSAFKHGNKLVNVLARSEAEAAGADEALLLNVTGDIAETSSGNIFWVQGETVITPPLHSGGLPGVTRGVVIEVCNALGFSVGEIAEKESILFRCDGAFLTMSGLGVVEIASLNGRALPRSPAVERIFARYLEALERETR